jgi:hypothetical protein
LIVGLIAVAIHVPWTVEAEDSKVDDSFFTRFSVGSQYVGFGGALGLSNFDDYDAGDPTGGVTLRYGGRPYKSFAWEVASEYFIKFGDGNARPLLATANGRWMIPATFGAHGNWQPFLLAGGGWMQARHSKNGNFERLDSGVIRLGTGVEMYQSIDTAWRLDAQYMIPIGDASDFQFAAILITIQLF